MRASIDLAPPLNTPGARPIVDWEWLQSSTRTTTRSSACRDGERQGDQGRLPQAGAQVPPGRQQGRREGRSAFKEINEANEVLSDPEKRQRYDTLGPDWANFRQAPAGPGPAAGGPRGLRRRGHGRLLRLLPHDLRGRRRVRRAARRPAVAAAAGFEEIFAPRRPSERPARTSRATVELTLDEVLRGTTRTHPGGRGRRSPRTVEVKIPPGVREGSRVRAAGEGAPGGKRRQARRPLPAREGPAASALRAQGRRPAGDGHGAPDHRGARRRGAGADAGRSDRHQGPARAPRPGRVFRLRGHGLPRLEAPGERGDLLAVLGVDLPAGPHAAGAGALRGAASGSAGERAHGPLRPILDRRVLVG